MEVDDTNESKRKIPAYYYLQPSKNGDEEAEEELYDSNGTHITSDYLNDIVAETMSDRYTVVQDSPSDKCPHYKCNECEKLLPNTGHLIAHMVVHTGENPYVCSLCQRSFANSTRLKLHLKVHCIKKLHPGLTVTRITKTVPATPSIPSTNMEVDVDQTSPTVKVATFRCIECEEILPKDTLYRHMKQHLHDKNIFAQKPHQCNRCGDAFAKASTLESHQESCQASPIKVSSEVDLVPINKQEPCSSLKKQIEANPILSGLLLREQKEPPISVTTIELEQAEEQTRVKVEEDSSKTDELHNLLKTELDQLEEFNSEPEQQMEEFLPATTAEQPVSGITNSSSSGIGFVISSVATVDQKFLEDLAQMELQARSPELEEIGPADELPEMSATPATGLGSFGNPLTSTTCTLCGKSFSEPFGLRQHMRIMHADTKPFKCPECRKRFAKEQAMLIHLRVHISNRPFMCIVCYKTFTRATALNGHLSSHSHDSLKCFACLEMLPNVQKYAQHIELNHPEFPEVLYRIRAEKPEHERTKLLRRLLLQHQAAPSSIGREATSHTNQ